MSTPALSSHLNVRATGRCNHSWIFTWCSWLAVTSSQVHTKGSYPPSHPSVLIINNFEYGIMLLKYLKYYLTFVHIKIINPLACYLGFLMKIKVHSHEQILLFSDKEKKQDCELIFLSFPSNFSAKCKWDMEETK